MSNKQIDLSKLDSQTRAQIEREIARQEMLLGAAIRMTRRNMQTPLLKRNRRKGWMA